MAASLKGIAGVVVAEPDWIARELRLPNDPLLNFMWHVEAMRLPAAWDITTGSSTTRVGVVDSGVINHEDLRDNFAGGLDFVSNVGAADDGEAAPLLAAFTAPTSRARWSRAATTASVSSAATGRQR